MNQDLNQSEKQNKNQKNVKKNNNKINKQHEKEEKLSNKIKNLQKENIELKRQHREIYEILEKVTTHTKKTSKFYSQLQEIKMNTESEFSKFSNRIGRSEEQTIEELRTMWLKIDSLEQKLRKETNPKKNSKNKDSYILNDSFVEIGSLKEEIKNIKSDVKSLFSTFGNLNQGIKSIEIDHHSLCSKLDDVVKEQQFHNVRTEYDIEHMKRLIEENGSKIRGISLELTTLKSRMEARLTYTTKNRIY
jgi:chromosome segregation ATPase